MKGTYAFFHKLLAAFFRFIFRIKVCGREYEPKTDGGAYLICANHMSGWDVIWLAAALKYKQIHFMAKSELFKIPLLGWLIRSLGAYPVNRGAADISSIRTTMSMLENGECVCIFPQGHRYRGINPLDTEVKSGAGMIAYRSGVDVLPVYIKAKNFRSSVFAGKTVIIGKPIPNSIINKLHDEGAEYGRISRFIFNEICALGGLIKKEYGGEAHEHE